MHKHWRAMNSEYPVEKLKKRVAIVLTDGRRLGGEVFLRPVARAETEYEGEADFEAPVLGVPVEVTTTDGNVCKGNIFLETRSDRPRLLDFLNSYRGRFVPVVDVKKIFLVNTQTIAHVRE